MAVPAKGGGAEATIASRRICPQNPRVNRRTPFLLALAWLLLSPAQAQDVRTFSSKGLALSKGVVVRVSHPAQWKMVPGDEEGVLAELQGPQGKLTGILQVARGRKRNDMATACQPERAATMLQQVAEQEQGARVTDAVARVHEGRPAFELRYERNAAPTVTRVRSLIVCLKDSQLLVSCAGEGRLKGALPEIDAVCNQVMDSLTISEE
jgi:hypothetical protein